MLRTIRTAAVAAAVLASASAAALAGQQDFTVVNDSAQDIYYLFVSPQSSDNWGDDILGQSIIPAGDYVDVQMDNFGSECLFDIQVANAYGETLEFWGVDLCSVSQVVVQ
ncbi:MAG: hypothetical protein R3F55_24915 [Alphaproteobacteria bacterium]